MNIQNYISSGILELYAMGILSASEEQEVEVMLTKYDAIKLELLEIQETLESYALLHAIEPPAYNLQTLLKRVEEERDSLANTSYSNLSIEKVEDNTMLPNMLEKRLKRLQFLTVAATILLVLSAVLNWKYHTQLKKANTEIALLNQEQESLVNNFNSMQAKYSVASTELNVLQNPSNKIVKMKGTEGHPESLAYVYWNTSSQEVYIKIGNLPDIPTEKQYQLWALKDGKPIDAGVFDVESGILKVKNIEVADAFAVTLEPKGGSKVPTLEELYVMGEIKLI